jgi:hypothetical protein
MVAMMKSVDGTGKGGTRKARGEVATPKRGHSLEDAIGLVGVFQAVAFANRP